MKLFKRWLRRFRFEPDGDDGRFRGKLFEMRWEHPEKRFDVVRRLGNFESMLVTALVRRGGSVRWRIAENNFELQFAGDEMERVQPDRKLLKKAPQHEEERLARLNFIFEFEPFLERFPDRDELEQPRRFSGGAFPKLNANRSKPGRDRFFFQHRELA